MRRWLAIAIALAIGAAVMACHRYVDLTPPITDAPSLLSDAADDAGLDAAGAQDAAVD